MIGVTLSDLVRRRLDAAAALETAIARLGDAYRAYAEATSALEERTRTELARGLENAITMHLADAGLSSYLERKFSGSAPVLATLIENQHRTLAIADAMANEDH
jgi:hypothetical protein